jgi:hypothetical protein
MGNTVPYMGNTVPYMGNTVPYMGNTVPYMGNTVPYMGNTVPYMGNTVPNLGVSVRAGLSTLKDDSGNKKLASYDEELAKSLWTLQVLALWLTDGAGFTQFPTMASVVSKAPRGPFNPADPAPILEADGSAKADLRNVLNPTGNNATDFVRGPDARFGDALKSLLVDYAGTRKILGKEPPAQSKPWLEKAVARTRGSVPEVAAADDAFKAGNVAASRTSAASTDCSRLSDSAAAAAGCPPRATSGGGGGSVATSRTPGPSTTTATSKAPAKKSGRATAEASTRAAATTTKKKEDNTLLYVGLGLLGVAVVAGGVYYAQQQKKKKSSAVQKVKDASMKPGALPAPSADATSAASSDA